MNRATDQETKESLKQVLSKEEEEKNSTPIKKHKIQKEARKRKKLRQ